MKIFGAIGLTALVTALVGLAACGGDDDTSAPEPASDDVAVPDDAADAADAADADGGSGTITDPQPPGQAYVTVDGAEYTLTEPGALACTLSHESITFSFRVGDNEVTLGAGANQTDGAWFGSIDLVVADPTGEAGPISYFPDLTAHGDRVVVDGVSMAYTGPMRKQPANDGSNPPAVDVGDGTISITCP
jgi:hypothetical protein